MSEQDVKSMGGRFPTQRITLPLSEAARASLVAVRAAQEAARERARRQTLRTRAWLGGIVGGIAFGFVVFGARPPRHEVSRAAAARAAAVPKEIAAATSAANVPAPGPISPPLNVGAASQATPATAVATAVAQVSAAATDGSRIVSPDSACAESFGQRRWRLSIDACTQAFEAHPQDGAIALRLAHAYHARARLPQAGDWARRAIALDPSLAEAFVIVAHSEAQAGHPGAVIDAYREYLALAPRGWHASEARAAVRAHNKEQHAQLGAAVMPGQERHAPAVTLATGR